MTSTPKRRRRVSRQEAADRRDLEAMQDLSVSRVKIALVLAVTIGLIFALVMLFRYSDKSNNDFTINIMPWLKSLLWSMFDPTNYPLYLLLFGFAVIAAVRFMLPIQLIRRGMRPVRAEARGVGFSSLVMLLIVGLVLPVSVCVAAIARYPEMRFNACIGHLKDTSTVAVVERDGQTFATVAGPDTGVNKYALRKESGDWKIIDLYAQKSVQSIPGC